MKASDSAQPHGKAPPYPSHSV